MSAGNTKDSQRFRQGQSARIAWLRYFDTFRKCITPPFSQTKDWLVVLGFNATLTAKVISWRSVTHVFPGFLTPVLTQLFFPKPPTTFFTCFCRGERRKYAGKKSRLNRGSNSQPPGHDSDTLTTEPPGRAQSKEIFFYREYKMMLYNQHK